MTNSAFIVNNSPAVTRHPATRDYNILHGTDDSLPFLYIRKAPTHINAGAFSY